MCDVSLAQVAWPSPVLRSLLPFPVYISQTSTYVYNGEFSGRRTRSFCHWRANVGRGGSRDFVSAISIFVAISESGSLPPFTESGILSYGAPFYDQQLPSVRTTDADGGLAPARSPGRPTSETHTRARARTDPGMGARWLHKKPGCRGIKESKKMRRRISKWTSDSDGKIARSVV